MDSCSTSARFLLFFVLPLLCDFYGRRGKRKISFFPRRNIEEVDSLFPPSNLFFSKVFQTIRLPPLFSLFSLWPSPQLVYKPPALFELLFFPQVSRRRKDIPNLSPALPFPPSGLRWDRHEGQLGLIFLLQDGNANDFFFLPPRQRS